MLIGVDWGGTKIEIVALTPDGQEHLRSRQATPRGDYDGCLRNGLGKGASSTWIMGKPIVKARHGDSSGVRGAAWLWAED